MDSRSTAAPQLSVVTPLFNCLAHTRAMLESLARTVPSGIPYEVILVDDASTDGTREWLSTVGAQYRILLNERNLGFGAAINRGATAARGQVLALLNNDLVLGNGWLSPMLDALGRLGPRAGLIGNIQLDAATGVVDHVGIRITLKGKPEHDRIAPGRLSAFVRPVRPVVAVTGACIIVASETWRALGGFDEAYVNGCEDVDLCLRARERGLVNAVALGSRVLHHISASPGRKMRDEENTRRLVLTWRRRLAVLGSREWTCDHFASVVRDPRDFPDPPEAWRMALYMAHLLPNPPQTSLAGMNGAVEAELARWRKMSSH